MAQKPTNQCGEDDGNESSSESVRLRIGVDTEYATSHKGCSLEEAEPKKLLPLLWRERIGCRAMMRRDEVQMLARRVVLFVCQPRGDTSATWRAE